MMRACVFKDDPAYHPDAKRYRPFVNGVEIKKCFLADEDIGYISVYVLDKDGNYIIHNGELLRRSIPCKVELRKVE